MKQNNDEFVPETVDEQIERFSHPDDLLPKEQTPSLKLVQELKEIHKEDVKLLERVQGRYTAQVSTLFASATPPVQHPIAHSSLERNPLMHKLENDLEKTPPASLSQGQSVPKRSRSAGRRTWSLLAVAALCLLLIGGALTLLHQAHPSAGCNTCIASQKATQTPSSPATPSQQFYTVNVKNSGNHDQILSRFDATTGKTLWQFTIPPEITHNSFGSGYGESSGPINVQEANGILYFKGTDNNGTYVYALHASDGSLAWKYPYDISNYAPTEEVMLTDGVVSLSQYNYLNHQALVVALNATTGTVLWHSTFGSEIDLVAATGSTFYATGTLANGWTLYAFNARTGTVIWQKQYRESNPEAAPSPFSWQLAGGFLYGVIGVSPSSNNQTGTITLSTYNTATGDQKWAITLPGSTVSNLQVVQNTVYIVVQVIIGPSVFYARQASNGASIWQQTIHDSIGTRSATNSLAISNGQIYAVVSPEASSNSQDQLETWQASSGQPGWSYTTATKTTYLNGVVVDGDDVYLGVYQSDEIVVLDRQSGKQVKTITIGGQSAGTSLTKIFALPSEN